MPGYTQKKQSLQHRLRCIEGQVRALQRLVDDDGNCVEVLTQITAATSALDAVALSLLADHLQHCVQAALVSGGPDADDEITEAVEAVRRLVRSH